MAKKKTENSLAKTIILAMFFVGIVLVYFNHLTNKKNNQKKQPDKTELEALTDYDMVNDYPKSARDVVKLHCRYSKMIYGSDLNDSTLEKLGQNMRQLYATTLLSYNPESAMLQSMKNDISKMKEQGYSYKSYTLPEGSQIKYYEQKGVSMATMEVTLTMGSSDEVGYYYQQYVLVQEDGKWKILAWGESKLDKNKTIEN